MESNDLITPFMMVTRPTDGKQYLVSRTRKWQTVAISRNGEESGLHSQIDVASNGDSTMAVWVCHYDSGNKPFCERKTVIYANIYTANWWGSAYIIGEVDAGFCPSPRVVNCADGGFLVIWHRPGGIYATKHTVGAGWGVTSLIEPQKDGVSYLQAGINSAGDNLVTWEQTYGAGMRNIYAKVYSKDQWGDTVLLSNHDEIFVFRGRCRLADYEDGNFLSAYTRSEDIHVGMYNHKDKLWSRQIFSRAKVGMIPVIRVVPYASGNALLAWTWAVDQPHDRGIYSCKYVAGKLGTEDLVEAVDAQDLQVASYGDSGVVLAWIQSDENISNIYAKVGNANGWSRVNSLGLGGNNRFCHDAKVVVNNGCPVVIWGESNKKEEAHGIVYASVFA